MHTGCTFIGGLPKMRLQRMLEAVDQNFDVALCSEASLPQLLKMLFLTTKIKASSRVRSLGAKSFKELYKICCRAGERVRRLAGEEGWRRLMLDLMVPESAVIDQPAREQGWQDEWVA